VRRTATEAGADGMVVRLRELRRMVRWGWALLLMSSGCLWWAKRQLRAHGAVVTLMLHRVLGEGAYRNTHSLPGILIRERTFGELVGYVVRRCEPVDLGKVAPGEPSSKLRVAFTFDDGWHDNFEFALPIARAYQIPLTVFVCPGLVDRATPFWPEQVVSSMRAAQPLSQDTGMEELIERLKLQSPGERDHYLADLAQQVGRQGISVAPSGVDRTLSWPDIVAMNQAGVSFGSHTQTHQILTTVPAETARQEVRESKTAIESALKIQCNTFSYPNGNCSPDTREIVAEAGFTLAFTTERGAWMVSSDPLAIPRSNISEDNVVGPGGRFSAAMFEYMTFWKAWRATKVQSGVKACAQQQATPIAL
jgi:peptidoglycan/xylan/chitin deacetylase (PgdA/CDA1 family)